MKTLDFSSIELITGEDKDYHQELIGLYVHLFEDLSIKYKTQMLSGDGEKLYATIHRAKPSLITLGLTELLEDMKQSIALFSQDPIDTEKVQAAIEYAQKYCEDVIIQLKKYRERMK